MRGMNEEAGAGLGFAGIDFDGPIDDSFGAAVNDQVLRITKAEFDERCKGYLVKIFDDCPTVFMDSSIL